MSVGENFSGFLHWARLGDPMRYFRKLFSVESAIPREVCSARNPSMACNTQASAVLGSSNSRRPVSMIRLTSRIAVLSSTYVATDASAFPHGGPPPRTGISSWIWKGSRGLCQRNCNPEHVFEHDATCGDHTTGFERMRHHSVTASLAVSVNYLILRYLTLVSRAGLGTG